MNCLQVILNKFHKLERRAHPSHAIDLSNINDDQVASTIDNSNVVAILGVWGLPGSGKSTLCQFLCDSMYHDFQGNVVTLELPTELPSSSTKNFEVEISTPNRHSVLTKDLTHVFI
jgi:GTPase SAR1 family protein